MFSKLFGKKKKTITEIAPDYVRIITESTAEGFPIIAELLNEEMEFAKSPHIEADSNLWFRYIVFAGNLLNLETYFSPEDADAFKQVLIPQITQSLGADPETADSILVDYMDFLRNLNKTQKNLVFSMGMAIFKKYELNDYQTEHFQKLNSPNPKVMKELTEIIALFLWNWKAYLEIYKVSA
jgi:hypothetical protein